MWWNRRKRETVFWRQRCRWVGTDDALVVKKEEEMVLRHKVIARHESFSRRLGINTHTTVCTSTHTLTYNVCKESIYKQIRYIYVYIHNITFFYSIIYTHTHTNTRCIRSLIYTYLKLPPLVL